MLYLLIYITIGYLSGLWITYSFITNYHSKNKIEYCSSPFKAMLTVWLCTLLGIFTLPLYLLVTENKKLFKLKLWYTY